MLERMFFWLCRAAAIALSKAKDGHYQIACEAVFEGLFGEKPNESVIHPNRYLSDALDIQQRSLMVVGPSPAPGVAAPRNTQVSSVGTPGGMTPTMHTPGTSSSLQQQQSFMRTPINVTPQLGVVPGPSVQAPATHVETPPAIVGSPVAGLHRSA